MNHARLRRCRLTLLWLMAIDSRSRTARRVALVVLAGTFLLGAATEAQQTNVSVSYEGTLPPGWRIQDVGRQRKRPDYVILFSARDGSPRENEPGWSAEDASAVGSVGVWAYAKKWDSVEELRDAVGRGEDEPGRPAYEATTFSGHPALGMVWERQVEFRLQPALPPLLSMHFDHHYLLWLDGTGVRVRMDVRPGMYGWGPQENDKARYMADYARLKEQGEEILRGLRIQVNGESVPWDTVTGGLEPTSPGGGSGTSGGGPVLPGGVGGLAGILGILTAGGVLATSIANILKARREAKTKAGKAKEQQEDPNEIVGYILQVNKPTITLTQTQAGQLRAVVWQITADGKTHHASDASISVAAAGPVDGLKMSPTESGSGDLDCKLWLDGDMTPPNVTLTVSAAKGGGGTSKQVRVESATETRITYTLSPEGHTTLRADGHDGVSITARLEFAGNEPPDGADAKASLQFSINGGGGWLNLSAVRTNEDGSKTVYVTASAPNPDQPGQPPSSAGVTITAKHGERQLSESVAIELAALPSISARPDTIQLVAGNKDPGRTTIVIKDPGAGKWDFYSEFLRGNKPIAQVSLEETGPATAQLTLTAAELKPVAGEKRDVNYEQATLRVTAQQAGSDTLHTDIRVLVSLEGLFVDTSQGQQDRDGTYAVKAEGSKKITEADFRVFVKDPATGLIAQDETAVKSLEFTLLDPPKSLEADCWTLAQIDPQYNRIRASNVPSGVYRLVAEKPLPLGKAIVVHLAVDVPGKTDDEKFQAEIALKLITFDNPTDTASWELEVSRCENIISDYVPIEHYQRLKDMLDRKKVILGAAGIAEMRKRIWKIAQGLLLAEGAEGYKDEEKWANRITVTLEWTTLAGEVAVQGVLGLYSGAYVVFAGTVLYKTLASAFQAIQESKDVASWVREVLGGMFDVAEGMLVDRDLWEETLLKHFNKLSKSQQALIWAAYIGYYLIKSALESGWKIKETLEGVVLNVGPGELVSWLTKFYHAKGTGGGAGVHPDTPTPPRPAADPPVRPGETPSPKPEGKKLPGSDANQPTPPDRQQPPPERPRPTGPDGKAPPSETKQPVPPERPRPKDPDATQPVAPVPPERPRPTEPDSPAPPDTKQPPPERPRPKDPDATQPVAPVPPERPRPKDPDATQPVAPVPPERPRPTEPDTKKPAEPEGKKSADSDKKTPAEPDPKKPAEPEGKKSADSDKKKPAEPEDKKKGKSDEKEAGGSDRNPKKKPDEKETGGRDRDPKKKPDEKEPGGSDRDPKKKPRPDEDPKKPRPDDDSKKGKADDEKTKKPEDDKSKKPDDKKPDPDDSKKGKADDDAKKGTPDDDPKKGKPDDPKKPPDDGGKSAKEAERTRRKAKEDDRRAAEQKFRDDQRIPTDQLPQDIRDLLSLINDRTADRTRRRNAILELQRNTRSMRTLKNASDAKIGQDFNDALSELITAPHDTALVNWVQEHVPGMKGKPKSREFPNGVPPRPVRVESVRSPGVERKPGDVNTDNDYRVLYQDEAGHWIELDRTKWHTQSYDIYAKQSGYTPQGLENILPPSRRADLADELAKAPAAQHEAIRQRYWAEEHGQMPTDRGHLEAGVDYSDQAIDPETGRRIQTTTINPDTGCVNPTTPITEAEAGRGVLKDPGGLGRMYDEKIMGNLRRGNPAEAVAQAQKAVNSLRDLREAYGRTKDVGELTEKLEEAMHAVKTAHTDYRADPAALDDKLRTLGFPGGMADFSKAMSAQLESLKFFKK